MVALIERHRPADRQAWADFIATLTAVVAISSFGVAGVGGGATFAALIVLPAMGFPVTLAALLISIEPLIDMARTALNVNGSMTAGVITGRLLKDRHRPWRQLRRRGRQCPLREHRHSSKQAT